MMEESGFFRISWLERKDPKKEIGTNEGGSRVPWDRRDRTVGTPRLEVVRRGRRKGEEVFLWVCVETAKVEEGKEEERKKEKRGSKRSKR
jgi:hypothetical protein